MTSHLPAAAIPGEARRPCVFVHTNQQQMIGALVAAYALQRNSRHRDRFDVRIVATDDHPFLREREGQAFLRDGRRAQWRCDDLQSFTPLRFVVPELMGYAGRALVIDPDIFAIGDAWDLLARDMGGKAILCRARPGQSFGHRNLASSVMVLDCARLAHWRVRQDFARLFAFSRDYRDWICLRLEPMESIGPLEDEWNDFDRLTPATRMLHNTRRLTQPWKTGLPVDFTPARKQAKLLRPASWLRPLRRLAGHGGPARYRPHPDPRQEQLFFGLLRECLEQGVVSEGMLRDAMRRDHLRHDALALLGRRSAPADVRPVQRRPIAASGARPAPAHLR